jgi:hypothetical protein
VPLSADDGQIHRALTLEGCEIQGLFRERLSLTPIGLYISTFVSHKDRAGFIDEPKTSSSLRKTGLTFSLDELLFVFDIHRALTLEGCEIQGLFRERLRVDGKLTNCETGDRLIISKTLKNPIPRKLQ